MNNRAFLAAAAFAIATVGGVTAAGAQGTAAAAPVSVTHHIVRAPVSISASTGHDLDGERYDGPASLLHRPGVLINGLPPEALQYN